MAEAFLRNALDAAVIKSKWHVEEMKLHENPVVLLLTSLSLSKVLPPGSFQLDMWAMTDKEKLDSVPHIHEEGNSLFKQGKIKEATEKYYNAIACLKNLQMKVWEQFSWNLLSSLKLEWGLWRVCVCEFWINLQEHPGDESWVQLDQMITPLLLNYCQCLLLQDQYYEVIEHCSSLVFKYEGKVLTKFRPFAKTLFSKMNSSWFCVRNLFFLGYVVIDVKL